ncbi:MULTISPECIES: TonB-dependent siderophore receptor [unclassified Lentimonas]|uniref:TonB-dependent siderophore receptor n=1 Tax=unclassified Lentimonas TaxID=2630993 RepID=UPI0013279779|nr:MULTISPECIES: TonB-dependent receptor [unclassified Lentimonas]CAA6679620.1 Unannotated [Lentimonas sp. CC4]CAA6687338.1 Unannotated [Lentimonas sp. CC6]CAA7077233.1 Unannotated [Lentimonas sp. CC4]CAA7171748.1 Unannotated [Lentimonas sp. CC21]CAA7183550.1 Unannotated [Lentimonas sp. CC8]
MIIPKYLTISSIFLAGTSATFAQTEQTDSSNENAPLFQLPDAEATPTASSDEATPLFQLPDADSDATSAVDNTAEASEDSVAAFTIPDAETEVADSTTDEYGSADTESDNDPAEEDEVYHILPDFVVSAEHDRGYYSANSLAGSRTDALIKDTPMTIQAVNDQMISDLSLYDIDDLSGIIASAEMEDDGFSNRAIRFRGFRSSFQLFEFMPRQSAQDSYNVERAEIIRGANSLVYGQAAPGGKVNFLAKAAELNKDSLAFNTAVSDKHLFRADFDGNQIINDQLAIRVMGVHTKQQYNQDYKEKKYDGLTTALTYRPTEKTTVRLHLEGFKEERNSPPSMYQSKTGTNGMSGIPDGLPFTSDVVDLLSSDLKDYIYKYNDGSLQYTPNPSANNVKYRDVLVNIDNEEDLKTFMSGINAENTGTLVSPDEEREGKGFFAQGDVTHMITDDLQFKLSAMREEWQNDIRSHADPKNVYASISQGVQDEDKEVGGIGASNRQRLYMKPSWQKQHNTDNTTSLRNTLSWNTEVMGSKQQLIIGLDYDQRHSTSDLDALVYEGYVNADGTYAGSDATKDYYQFIFGNRDHRDNVSSSDLDILNPNISYPNGYIDGGVGSYTRKQERDATVTTSAPWTALQGNYFGGRLHTLTGIRYDIMNVDSSYSNIQDGGVGDDPNPSKIDENYYKASPSLGALFWLNKNWAVFANYAESIESPTGWKLTPDGDSVDPETGRGFEYGLKYDLLDGKLTGQFIAFHIEKQNDPLSYSDTVLRTLYPGLIDANDNFNKAGANLDGTNVESDGFEADIYYNPTNSISLFLGYAYLDTEITKAPAGIDEGSLYPGTARNTATFTARYSFKDGALKGWYCGLTQKYRDKSYLGNYYEDVGYSNDKFKDRNDINLRDGKSDVLGVNEYKDPNDPDKVTGSAKAKKHAVWLDDNFETSVFVGWRGKLYDKTKDAPTYNIQLTVINLFDAVDIVARGNNAVYTEDRTFVLRAGVQF